MQNYPDNPQAYLSRALDIMRTESLVRDSIDWDALQRKAERLALGASEIQHVYPAIRYALEQLGDHHSFFKEPREVEAWLQGRLQPSGSEPKGEIVHDSIGYVVVPAFISRNELRTIAYAVTLQKIIAELDARRPTGWIVDLRQNTGGNMWPMLAGLGPILGEGHLGAFVFADGKTADWWYMRGSAGIGGSALVGVHGGGYRLSSGNPKVAVLTGPATASSGEAVAVAFRGRPQNRSFGGRTQGKTTANGTFRLTDGAMLVLATRRFADRTGTVYGGVLHPDQKVVVAMHGEPSLDDPAIGAAVDWLAGQA